MDVHERRRRFRDTQFAGKPIEAIIEDGNGFVPITGAILVNHSDSGIQLATDINANLAVGKTLVLFINDAHSQRKNRIECVITWMSEHNGKVKIGCEFTYPIMRIQF